MSKIQVKYVYHAKETIIIASYGLGGEDCWHTVDELVYEQEQIQMLTSAAFAATQFTWQE